MKTKTNRKTRALLLSAIAVEQHHGLDYGTAFAAVAEKQPALVGAQPAQPPQFGNETFKGVAERREKLQAAVKQEMVKGRWYALAFSLVSRCPEFANATQPLNLANAGKRTLELQAKIQAIIQRQGWQLPRDYNKAFQLALAENPDLAAAMITPTQKPKGVFHKNLYGGPMTPAQPHSGSEGRSQSFARRTIPGDRMAENPAQRAERLAS